MKLRAQKETEINGQGPMIRSEDIRSLYAKLDQLKEGDTLVLAGSIPDTMPESIYMDIMEHLKDKKLWQVCLAFFLFWCSFMFLQKVRK